MKNTKFKLFMIISCLLFVSLTKANDLKSISVTNSEKNELATGNAQQTPDQQKIKVSGQVKDMNGEPVIGMCMIQDTRLTIFLTEMLLSSVWLKCT